MHTLATILMLTAISLVGPCPVADPNPRPQHADQRGPLSATEAATNFRLPGDLRIELVAAEPDVVDPVAVAWDEDGRMFVVEMGDYPTGPPDGRIKLLEDRDGDGRVDSSRVFADKLPFPTSVLPWRGGVLVAAAPDILFLKDTDGDGHADLRRVLFTGFGEGNQQLRVNGLTWGIDNWVYGANGRSDGTVQKAESLEDLLPAPATASQPNFRARERERSLKHPVSIRQRDFRFRPDFGRFEVTTGFSQFGLAFDDWGNRFLSWNTVHIRHAGLEQQYLDRNPYMPPAGAVREIAEHGSTCRVFPASRTTPRFNAEPPGYMNASCGLTIYRGDALPATYRGNAFVCEPLSNLVHRDVLEPAGTTFVARRHESESAAEFLTSTDSWFRPVNLATGPDGCLYVIDFCRPSVEHPQFVRDEAARKGIDWRAGSDRGRIWRIRGNEQRPSNWPKIGAAPSDELVRLLEHPNGWQRDTAQRLLIERHDESVRDQLAELAVRSESSVTRVHALNTLDGLGQLWLRECESALHDPNPEVRRHAVRLAASRAQPYEPLLRATLCAMSSDPDPRVRLQLACSLGDVPNKIGETAPEPMVAAALARIARRGIDDEWTRTAVLSSLKESSGEFLRLFIRNEMPTMTTHVTESEVELITQAAAVAGARGNMDEMRAVLQQRAMGIHQTDSPAFAWKTALETGLLDGHKRAGHTLDDWSRSADSNLHRLHDDAMGGFRRAASFIEMPERWRIPKPYESLVHRSAIRLLRHAPADVAIPALRSLVHPAVDQPLQLAAVAALGEQVTPDIAPMLLEHWPQYTPVVRRAVLATLLSRRDHVPAIVEALERKHVATADIDAAQTDLLLRLSDDQTRPRVQTLLRERASSDRRAVVESYQSSLERRGDPERGSRVFAQHCVSCHAIQGKGNRVGPDLASVSGRPPAENLADILDPNRAVAPEAVSYVIATRSGRVVSGLIGGESAAAVTLRRAEGIDEVVPRSDIEEIRSTGKSLMPEGLEREIQPQDMIDLLEFLRSGEPPEKE
jgi:putative membrane-bound dehydrogenase-like protein